MYIQPGQDSISWEQFQHMVDAISFIGALDINDAVESAFEEVMRAGFGIHCAISDFAKHTETMTAETLEILYKSGGL